MNASTVALSETMWESLAVFVAALTSGYLLARWQVERRKPCAQMDIPIGTRLRIVTPGGSYRCHMEADDSKFIEVSAPLHRDSYVPLRICESVIVQCPTPHGLLSFRSTVSDRVSETHRLRIAKPSTFRTTDRRSYPRTRAEASRCVVNGTPSVLIDMSVLGAKVHTPFSLTPGESVRIELPETMAEVYGWVLEASRVPGSEVEEARIRFEESIAPVGSLRLS